MSPQMLFDGSIQSYALPRHFSTVSDRDPHMRDAHSVKKQGARSLSPPEGVRYFSEPAVIWPA